MNYRRLGRSGLKASELSFGSWVTYGNQVDTRAARELMAAAYDTGVNFFDNAEIHARGQSEEIMGAVLKGVPAGSRGALEGYAFLREGLTDPAKNTAVARLESVAGDLSCTLAQLALAWCLTNRT